MRGDEPLPRAIHDLQDASGCFGVIDPSGSEFRAADVLTKRDDGLIDDHGFAVHRRMVG